MPEVRLLLDVRNRTGECPLWSVREQALYWEDIYAPAIYRFDPTSGETTTWPMPAQVGAFGLRAGGGLIVGLRTGIHFFDPACGALTFVVDPEPDRPENRLNDGKVSPEGRFWIGSMFDVPGEERQRTGALYRVDPDGSCHRMLDGLLVPNGLAWSPDGRTMYHSDSRDRFIKAFDYDPASGSIANGRVIARPGEADGRPDGGAMDGEGCYWSAGVSAGCLNRYRPDGTLADKIPVPTPSPTMCCFGGADLRTLYITSHREKTDLLDRFPTAGGVFVTEVAVPGIPVGPFAG
jgi:sugar lactone lactonase YvrE